MTEPEAAAQPEGADVYIITYDEEGYESRLLPAEVHAGIVDRSRHLGIGAGGSVIIRVKHGLLIAADSELSTVNVGSLARAVSGNYYGTVLVVDRTAPPVNDDLLDLDERYHLDVQDDQLVAVVRERYLQQPNLTPAEIAASLERIVESYDCEIVDVGFTLAGGGTPEEITIDFSGSGLDPEHAEQLNAEQRAMVSAMAHDVNITITTDTKHPVSVLMRGAAALADYLHATHDGPLHADGVLNLLRGGHFNLLLGEKESAYLEVKTAMHPIWVPGAHGDKAKIELAQDVARFANGDVDAILVIGYRETSSGGNEIGSITPVGNTDLNLAQISEVLDARIVPPLDGLVVETFAVSATESILAVYVPRQPAEMQPYLVHGAIAEGKVEGAFFSIVRRRGEGSITTSAQQIHAYIVAGKRYLRGEDH